MAEITGKIARKYMAHYLDASFGGTSAEFVRLGKDLEEFNVELNPDTETSKNIIGEQTFKHNGNERSSDVDPYYAEVGDPLFEKLQKFVDEDITDDQLKTDSVEVHLWEKAESDGVYTAWKQACYVVPQSYGGDTSGYTIPFSVNYVGERVKGTFDVATKKFTAAE